MLLFFIYSILISFFLVSYLFNPKTKTKFFIFSSFFLILTLGLMYFNSTKIDYFNYEKTLAKELLKSEELNTQKLIIFLEMKLKRKPMDLEGWLILIRTYIQAGYFQKAEKSYDDLLLQFPKNEELRIEVALFKKGINDINEGIKELEIVKKINPDNIKNLILLAEFYFEKKNFKKVNEIITLIKKNPNSKESTISILEEKMLLN